MPVTERLQADGSWSLTLDASTPKQIRDQIQLLDHVALTPARIVDTAVSSETVLASARYTGVLRDRPGDEAEQGYRIGGPGLGWWLKTAVVESPIERQQGSLTDWTGDLFGLAADRLTAGSVSGSGALSHRSHLETVRAALDYVVDHFDVAWRVNPNGTVDVSDGLFVVDPDTVIMRGSHGRDPNTMGLPAERMERAEDLEDYANRVVVVADEGETVASDEQSVGDIPYTTLLGNTARIARLVDAPNTETANVSTVAARELSRRSEPRRALTLSSDVYDIARDVQAGDTVDVYDPDVGLVDVSRQLLFRGRTVNPVALQTHAVTWPVQDGMGVYLLTDEGPVDLSEWVVWEDGPSRLEVGAQSRRLTPTMRDAASEDVAKWDKFDTHMRDYVDTSVAQGQVGYSGTTSDQGPITSEEDLNALDVEVDVPAGRVLKVTVKVEASGGDGDIGRLRLYEDSSSIGGGAYRTSSTSTANAQLVHLSARVTPSAGEHTYRASLERLSGSGTHTMRAGSARPAFMLVEDIGPAS